MAGTNKEHEAFNAASDDAGDFLDEGGGLDKVKRAYGLLAEAAAILKAAGWETECNYAAVFADEVRDRVRFRCVESAVRIAGAGSIVAARAARRFADLIEGEIAARKAA